MLVVDGCRLHGRPLTNLVCLSVLTSPACCGAYWSCIRMDPFNSLLLIQAISCFFLLGRLPLSVYISHESHIRIHSRRSCCCRCCFLSIDKARPAFFLEQPAPDLFFWSICGLAELFFSFSVFPPSQPAFGPFPCFWSHCTTTARSSRLKQLESQEKIACDKLHVAYLSTAAKLPGVRVCPPETVLAGWTRCHPWQ